jgi:hypothetical protein
VHVVNLFIAYDRERFLNLRVVMLLYDILRGMTWDSCTLAGGALLATESICISCKSRSGSVNLTITMEHGLLKPESASHMRIVIPHPQYTKT